MTNAELNARAAEIMGYTTWKGIAEIHKIDGGGVPYIFFPHGNTSWNPAENIAQAFVLAHEMCEDYELKYNGDIYDFTIAGVLRRSDSLPDAITRACVAAAERK